MSDITQDQIPKSGKPRTKLLILALAGALVLAGGTTAIVTASSAYAAETKELCTTALAAGKAATEEADRATGYADSTLKSIKLAEPFAKDRGELAQYLKRPEVKAVKAAPAKDGKPEVKAVEARPSGADVHKAFTDDRAAVAEIDVAAECTDREQAEAVTANAKKLTSASEALTASTKTLLDDFTAFRKEVAAQIAAEKKAEEERIAAEKAAAEAAAAEAARIAAEQAAAEQAAWEAQQYIPPSNDGGWTGGGDSGWTGGGGNSGGGGGGGGNSGGGGGGGGGGGIILPPGGGGGCPAGMTCHG